MKIKELNCEARPREKLIKFGSHNLSNIDLLAILIGSGTKKQSVIELANDILNQYSLSEISELSFERLTSIKGIKTSKACTIMACFEFVRRSYNESETKKCFVSAEDVYLFLYPTICNKNIEYLYILYVDAKARLIQLYLACEGDIATVNVPIRKIISKALEINAYALFMVHNHPTGDVTPSYNDKKSTFEIISACQTVGIEFVDHIIIGKKKYYSFFESGNLNLDSDI